MVVVKIYIYISIVVAKNMTAYFFNIIKERLIHERLVDIALKFRQ